MKHNKNIKWMLLAPVAAFVLLVSSCGQAGFDVTMKPADVKDIDLSLLTGSGYTIKVETYVETGDLGIDLSKLVYNYTLKNKSSSKDLKIEVRLSLFGEATSTDNNKISILNDSTGNGYEDEDKAWLASTYKDTVSPEGYGWVSMIGSYTDPVSLAAGSTIPDKTEIINNQVINQVMKQKGVWIDVYISPDFSIFTFSSSDFMDLINQSIKAVGSKPTGYFPGAFGGL